MSDATLNDDAAFWDTFSPKYDGFMARTGGVYAKFVDRLAPDLRRLDRVLDVGTGTGALALHLAPMAAHIDAVDLAPGSYGLGLRLPCATQGAHEPAA